MIPFIDKHISAAVDTTSPSSWTVSYPCKNNRKSCTDLRRSKSTLGFLFHGKVWTDRPRDSDGTKKTCKI